MKGSSIHVGSCMLLSDNELNPSIEIPDQELRLMNLLTRLLKLPPANYDTLKALVAHLSR